MYKRGNGHRKPKNRNRQRQAMTRPELEQQYPLRLAPARLTLHGTDPLTDNDDLVYTLFYEGYRGYTIYSTEQGVCCIHGRDGCLRIKGKYVCFPDVEEAKTMIKHFQADGRSTQASMNRYVPEREYRCLNRTRRVPPFQPARSKQVAIAV